MIHPFLTALAREFSRTWKSATGYRFRFYHALAAFLLGVVLIVHWAIDPDRLMAPLVRSYFGAFALAQVIIVSLFGLAVFPRLLAREREGDTLDLFILASGHRIGALLGSALGNVLVILAFLVAALPFVCYLLIFGGLDLSEVLSTYVNLLGLLGLLAGIAIPLAARIKGYREVMLRTLALLLVCFFAHDIATNLLPPAWGSFRLLKTFSPFHVLTTELATVWPSLGPSLRIALIGLGVLMVGCVEASIVLRWTHTGRIRKRWRWKAPLPRRGWLAWIGSWRILDWMAPGVDPWQGSLRAREHARSVDAGFRGGWLLYLLSYAALVITGYLVMMDLHVALIRYFLDIGGIRDLGGEWFWWLWAYPRSFPNPTGPPDDFQYFLLAVAGGGALLLLLVQAALGTYAARRSGAYEVLLAANVEASEIVRTRLAGQFIRCGYVLLVPAAHGLLLVMHRYDWNMEVAPAFQILPGTILGLAVGVVIATWLAFRIRSTAAVLTGVVLFALPPALLVGWAMTGPLILALLVIPPTVLALVGIYARTVNGVR